MTPERARKIAKDCADSWYGGASGLSLKEAITQGILEACQEIEGDLVATRAERDTYRQDLAAAQALLPGVYYMDPPDGGDVDLIEQLRRMAKDALRYRWLRRNPTYLGWEHDCPPEFIDANVDAALAAPGEGK